MAILISALIHIVALSCLFYALFKANSLKGVAASMLVIFPAIVLVLTFLAKQMLTQPEFLLVAKQYLFLIADIVIVVFLKVAKDGTKINKAKGTPVTNPK